jgi:hypothetical protein
MEGMLKVLQKEYSEENVSLEGKEIVLNLPDAPIGRSGSKIREAVASMMASRYQGRVKPARKTDATFSNYSLTVKPQKQTAKRVTPVYYGILAELDLKEFDTSAFRDIDTDFAGTQKKLPRELKEDSDRIGVSEFNKALEAVSGKMGLTLKFRSGGKSYTAPNVVGAVAVVGKEPKTDFVLVSRDGKTLYPSCYISYKKKKEGSEEANAKDFQNYSGISDKSSQFIWNHKETKHFFKTLLAESAKSPTKRAINVKEEIDDEKIVQYSIYGADFGKKFGLNNINLVAQGSVSISRDGVVHYSHVMLNGYIPERTSEYYPVYGARRTTNRVAVAPSGERVIGYRVGIFPRVYRAEWMR